MENSSLFSSSLLLRRSTIDYKTNEGTLVWLMRLCFCSGESNQRDPFLSTEGFLLLNLLKRFQQLALGLLRWPLGLATRTNILAGAPWTVGAKGWLEISCFRRSLARNSMS